MSKEERQERRRQRKMAGREQMSRGKKFGSRLGRLAMLTGNPLGAIASKWLGRNKKAKQWSQRYVEQRGMEPSDDEEELIPQFAQARDQHVQERLEEMQAGNPATGEDPDPEATYEDAHEDILGYEAEMYGFDASNYDSADNFIPAIIGAVGKLGQAAGKAIGNARAKKGKTTFWQRLFKKKDGSKTGAAKLAEDLAAGKKSGDAQTDLGAGALGIKEQVRKDEINATLKKNLPLIIIGVVVLGVILFMVGKKSK